MTGIEGFITSLKVCERDNETGIDITIHIPQPRSPYYPIISHCQAELNEFEKAELEKYEAAKKKFQGEMDNMYSLCLEDVSIYPHRELPAVSK